MISTQHVKNCGEANHRRILLTRQNLKRQTMYELFVNEGHASSVH